MVEPRSLVPLTVLPSLVFEAIVRARDFGYRKGLLRTRVLERPVISVGNISVGGTGKTPIVVLIARLLVQWGRVPALLSRGYGRRRSGTSVVLDPGSQPPGLAGLVGDEPALVRRLVPGIWLGIDANRARAGRAIGRRGSADVFLLDDGFQHRSLRRDLDIVVVDRTQPFAADRLLPRGRLREPLSALERAHVILLNGGGAPTGVDPLERQVRQLSPRAEVFRCVQAISGVVSLAGWRSGVSDAGGGLRADRVFVVAAIGNPTRLLSDIEASGRQVCGTRLLRDHTAVSRDQWARCVEQASRAHADCILITEKDAVKAAAAPSFPVGVCVQSTTVDRFDDFARVVRGAVRGAA